MRRLLRVLAGALFVAGCSGEVAPAGEPDAGPACIDLDHDGFGQNCAFGRDCDDQNPRSTNDCRTCAHPDLGCPCEKGQQAISCFGLDQPQPDGNVMCREGTRFCRDERWSACEDIHTYVVTPDRSLTGLVTMDAAPDNCSPCDVLCFKVKDPLLSDAGGTFPGTAAYGANGGIVIAPGTGTGGAGGGGTGGTGGTVLMGCTGLMACCSTLDSQVKPNCDTVVSGNNDPQCNAALQVFCPNTIGGPINGCTLGTSSTDSDCDGIPDVLDECTPATIATNPKCNGTTLPLTTTNNQTIFHILDKGETGSNSLEIGFKVQNADIYFLLDTSDTMNQERDQLVSSLTGCPVGQSNCPSPNINVVECALLKNCCDRLPDMSSAQNACNNVVASENTTNCKNAEASYCTGASAPFVHCPDLNFDGLPDDDLKNQGVVGAVRCLVGSAWFGAGYFREIPFGGQNLGDVDEHAFRHWVDMTPNVDRVREAISQFQTNGNSDYPEADMVALYSLLTGKGAAFGNTSLSIPERLGLGCPADTFGYPCFRKGTIPIVVLFTDDPMHNGPPVYAGGGAGNTLAYAAAGYTPNNSKIPTKGVVRYTPVEVETFAHPFNFGSINGQFAIAGGSLQYMAGDYPASITGCGAATSAPDAVYAFKVDPLLNALGIPIGTPVTVKIGINTVIDGDSLQGQGPTPPTDKPVVVSLYRGVPSGIPSGRTHLTDSRVYAIPSGPDLAYLMYDGTTAGTGSQTGFLGGISGCGADGKTNEVAFTFRPTVNAKIVIDSSATNSVAGGFNSVISLHQGLPGSLPPNPSGSNYVPLVQGSNDNDTFATARSINVGGKIDNAYVTYVGDTVALGDTGSGNIYNVPGGRAGKDDYDDTVVSCGVNPVGVDAVYKFDVQTPRRVRIDTEGSKFKTVISLHDALPPQAYVESDITGNSSAPTSKQIGTMSGDSVTNTQYYERSDSSGTSSLADRVDPVCGGVATDGSNDAFYRFSLTAPTHLSLTAPPRRYTAAAGQAYNTPGAANEAVSTNAPPRSPHPEPVINEFVVAHNGGDTHEFIEVYGQPNTNYAAYKLLQIEGDVGSNEGDVVKLMSIGTTNASGLWVTTPYFSGDLQNGTSTLLLVKDYTGTASSDIDADDNGVTDLPALWSRVIDAVAIDDGGSGDRIYEGATVLTKIFDGGSTTVGGASRIPSGKDTETPSDWLRNDVDGDGLPGFGFDPIVFLYSSPPGTLTTKNASSNSHNTSVTALNLGDVFGQVDTKVDFADLSHTNTANDYGRGVLSCNGHAITIGTISGNTLPISTITGYTPAVGDMIIKGGTATIATVNSATSVVVDSASGLSSGAAMLYPGLESPGNKDHVYKFTPTADGTVRINTATSGGSYEAVAIYDGPPPTNGAVTAYQLFDASKLTVPDTGCTAWSFDADKADAAFSHLYWVCPTASTWQAAEIKCNVGGGHLVRIDNGAENAFVATHRTGTPAWIGGKDAGSNSWRWSDNNDEFWSGGSGGSATAGRFASWRSGQPGTGCVEFKYTGTDNAKWDGVSCTGSAQFVCEYPAPTATPPESVISAYPVGKEISLDGNMAGKVLAYVGSTRRMDSDITTSAMSPCGAASGSPDAVFMITPLGAAPIQVTIDTSGSSFPAIVGLFRANLSTYIGCDAPGVAPDTNVTVGTNPASTLPLGGTTGVTLDPGVTYYAVIKGTSASPDGAYQIKFTDLAVDGDGIELACSKQTGVTDAAAEADFSANHTYYVIVESTDAAGSPYTMTAHSLYKKRVQSENPLAQNEHGGTALSIEDPYRSKIQVVNTSTTGMAANYTTDDDTTGGLLTCGTSSAAPDAVYKFTPTIDTKVRVAVNMPGKSAAVALFKGQPGSFPTVTDLAPGNTNENTQSAYQVNLSGPAQTLLGDTTNMTNDIDGSLVSCGASPTAKDAVFRFSLSKQTQVQIDASASMAMGKMGDPVIALFHDYALEKPAPVTLENDSYTDADTHPTPTPIASDAWLSYKADMANMTPATQAFMSVAATNMNEVVNPTTLQGAQDLGDIWNTKVTVGGATTAMMAADYSASGWCGGNDAAPDAIYSFHSSQAGPVRISTAKPAPGFNTVIALFDGSTGAPLRAVDGSTTTVDLNGSAICGDGIINWNEQCDDGNATLGDGCEGCVVLPGVWRCDPDYEGTGDGCDCGCGALDPDCDDAAAACDTCSVSGSCNLGAAGCSRIDPNNNYLCRTAVCGDGFVETGEQCDDGNAIATDGCDACVWKAGVWHCDPLKLGGGNGCDCGCGLPDPDCAGNANVSACVTCNLAGGCNSGACPGGVNPTNNATCTSFKGGGNPNDGIADGIDVNLSAGGTRKYTGSTAALHHDVPSTQIQCGATSTAPDAVFSFSLRKATQVQIDATNSPVGNKPVIALFNSAALGTAPQALALENDEAAQADVNPSPTPQIRGNWVAYTGDISDLSNSTQPQTAINNQDNVNNDTQTELPDPINRRDTVTNADTSLASVQATYPAPTCGGVDTSRDQLYRFVPSQNAQVRISTNYPATKFGSVVAVYDGSNGAPPLTRAQMATTTTPVTLNETQLTAARIPLEAGGTYVDTGSTSSMMSDVPETYFREGAAQCGAQAGSKDALFSFSLSKTTDVEISAQGSAYGTVLGLFDSPFVRPSVTEQSSLVDSITQLYDPDRLPNEPEAGCTPYDFNLHRYWLCSQKRPWDDARVKCQQAGGDLVVIDNQLENDTLFGQIAPTGESHLIGLRARFPYTSWGSAPVGQWVDGSSPPSSPPPFPAWVAGEPNQPENSGARMRSQDGAWLDVPTSWQKYRYLCEENSPAPLPQPPTATTPQVVDILGSSRHFVGSTVGTPNSVGNLIGCGAQATASDAVFSLVIKYRTDVTLNFGSSFAGSVVGLFKDSIGAVGYQSCAYASDSSPQLSLTNLAPATYYVVLTGTTAGLAGRYDVLFSGTTTDLAAFTMENDKLVDAVNNPIGDITNRWFEKRADMAHLGTDLITSRVVDMLHLQANSSHVTPYAYQDLGSTTGEQVNVINATILADPSQDYAAPTCGVSSLTADAIYKFTPTKSTPVRISVAPTGSWSPVVALFRGPDYPLLRSQVPAMPQALPSPNTNDAPSTAKDFVTIADPVIYTGDLATLANNTPDVPTIDTAGRTWDRADVYGGDASNVCNALPTGKDAFFSFTITPAQAPKTVVFQSAQTAFAHTLALWKSTDLLVAPPSMTAEYDTLAAAPNMPIDNQWYALEGNTTAMMPGADSKVTKVAGTHFNNATSIQNLGTLDPNTQIVTSGADTTGTAATYDSATLTCGAAPSAHDIIFKFHTGVSGGPTRITVNNPAAAFPPVLALFDGTGGKVPLTASMATPTATATGNSNSSRANPYIISPNLGTTAVAFSGDTSMLGAGDGQAAPLYNQAPMYGVNTCNAGGSTKDAFFRFTLPTDARVRIQPQTSTTFAHTIAIYDAAVPVSAPTPTAAQYNTYALANAAPIATIDKNWLVYTANMSPAAGMGIGELAAPERFFAAGTDFQNAATVQDMNAIAGTISGKQFRTKAASSYAGGADTSFTGATYLAPCAGGNDSANDMIWKIRPTTDTKLRIGIDNPLLTGFSPQLAVYDGAPLTAAEIATVTYDENALSPPNPNETFANAKAVNVGSRTIVLGNEASMFSHYLSTQFQAFQMGAAPKCSPAQPGADAFVQVNVRTVPDSVQSYAQIWLDAADASAFSPAATGAVTTWNDESTKAHHATQSTAGNKPSRQLVSGTYAVEFNSTGDTDGGDNMSEDYLDYAFSSGQDSPVSVFAVWKLINTNFLASSAIVRTDVPSGAIGFGLRMSADGSSSPVLNYSDSTSPTSVTVPMTGVLTGATGPMLSEVTHDATGAIATYLNGNSFGSGSGRVGGTQYQHILVGANNNHTRGLPMDLYELIVVSRAVSQSERETIEGYLAAKWGLQGSLPSGHPYKSSAPTRSVEISSGSTAFAHTVALFNAVPMTEPAATAGSAYDTSDVALQSGNRMGAVDSSWLVRSASTAGMHIDDLNQAPGTAAADHAIQNLGAVNTREIYINGATTSGYDASGADYPAATCGSSSSAPDAMYLVTASPTTTPAHIALRNPAFTGDLALYEAPANAPTAVPWTTGMLGLAAAETPLAATNETIATARTVTFPTTPSGGGYTGYAAGFNGTPVTSNVAGTAFQVATNMSACSPDTSSSGKDAFFKFTVPNGGQREIEISAAGTGGDHVLALFDRDPGAPAKPAVTIGSFASNVDTTMLSFSGAPTWTCSGGTTVINSGSDANGSGAAITSTTCTGGTPTVSIVSQSSGPKVVLIKLGGLTLSGGHAMTLKGSLPVVFAVNGNVVLGSGSINADSVGNGTTTLGAGGSYTSCGTSAGNPGVANASADDKGNGGGSGGAFRTAGPAGGAGHNTGGAGGVASSADTSAAAASLKPLRGGCKAGDGAGTASTGGAGGGAFQISASGSVTLNTGIVLSAAGGAGQKGNNQEDGGGGGGSGGAILIEGASVVETVTLSSVAFTNGGGGASGQQTDATNGAAGEDGKRTTVQANGGSSTNGAGAGGKGGASAGSATAGSAGSGYTPTGSYSKAITIDHTQVSAPLSNFPMLVKITSTDLTKALASHADIYFVSSNGTTTIPYEIETFTQSTGALTAWVQVPSVSNTAPDTVIYLMYGDGATHTSPGSVWDSSYWGVWHFNSNVSDSSSNNRTSANHNTTDGAGQIGNGRVFADTNYISTTNFGNATVTYSLWVKMSTSGLSNAAPMEPIDAAENAQITPRGSEMVVGTNGNLGYYYDGGSGGYTFGSSQVPNNSWAYVVEQVSAASGGFVKYSVNGGAFTVINANTSSEATSGPLMFGRWAYACNGSFLGNPYPSCFVGSMDEIHVSTTLRSIDWSKAEYNNQKAASTFFSLGTEVAPASKNGAGGGGGGGGQGYIVKSVISSPIWQADTASATLTGTMPGTFAADDASWTVKIADITGMTADWAVASSTAESSYTGGETADSPINLATPTNAKLTITGGSTATRASNYDINVCGADGGADTVYKFTPTSSGNMRIKVSGGSGTAISRPTVAVYNAYFGNGYFHGCSLQACVTDNDLDTSMPGAQGKIDSDATLGMTTITDLSVVGGTAYYLVVKSGGGTITNGSFNLEIAWKDPDDWAGCSEDTYDGKDAWFAFTTASSLASGGSYTIETENSTADTTIALYKDTDGQNDYDTGEFQTCADEVNGSASIAATLLPSTKYYVRVKQPVGGSSSGNVVIGVRNSAIVQNSDPVAVACSDSGSSYGYAKLVETLDPGTYYVGWRGGKGSTHYTGIYHVSVRDNSYLPTPATQIGCATTSSGGIASIDATLQNGRNYYVLVKGDGASGNSGSYGLDISDSGAVADMSCNGTSAADGAPDAFEAFTVTGTKDVTVNLSGSTLNGVYELYKDNGASDTKIGCGLTTSTAGFTDQLDPGNYYVKVRGTSATGSAGEQPFQVSVRDDDVQRAFDCSDGASSAGTTITKTLTAGAYYVGLKPQGGATAGSYQLTVRDPSFNSTNGAQQACTTTKTADVNVTANHDYYVLVKGTSASDKGQYGLTVTDIGALDTTTSAYDTRTDIGCGANLAAPDNYYSFTVATAPRHIEISLGGGFSGAFQLYRDDGTFTPDDAILGCSTGTQQYTLTTAGRYFLVAKGLSVVGGAAEGTMQVSIKDLDAIGSIACANGDATTPAVLQSSNLPSAALNGSGQLKAGTYYVAFTGQGTADGAYALQFNNQDAIGTLSAPVMQCTNSLAMTQTLAANTDYYAIVKGDGPPNQGMFTLAVTDVSGVKAIDSTCPTDLAAPDGYAAFTLASGPRDIRIDMSASTLTGAFQVFTSTGSAVAGCGCSSIATPATCNLASGSYYVVYRGNTLAAGLAQKPFKLAIQDISGLGSRVCADGPANTGTTLTTPALGAGTYYVGIIPTKTNTVTNYNYRLSVKDSTSVAVTGAPQIGCNASQIDASVNANEPYYIVVKGKNNGDAGDYSMTVQDLSGVPSFGCGDDTTSGDAFYSFDVTNPAGSNVTIDSEGSMLSTVLALFPSTANFGADLRNNTTRVCCNPVSAGAPTGACNAVATCDGKPDDLLACDSNSGPSSTSLINGVHLAPGTYYIVVRARLGATDKKLPFNLSVRDDDGVPSTYCSEATNLTTGQARIRHILQPGTYWAALKGSSSFSPSSGNYSVRFRDYAPFAKAAPEIACNTASDTVDQSVIAGKPYYVVVKGDTDPAKGQYKLTVENAQAAVTMGCFADPQSPDGFYKFSLTAPTLVSIDTNGSALNTVIAVYNTGVSYFGTNYAADNSGNIIDCDDDGGQAAGGSAGSSRIYRTLPAGSYYVAIRGKINTGATWGNTSKPYKLSIRDESASANIDCAPSSLPRLTYGPTNPLPPGDYKLVVSDDGPGGTYDIRFKDLSAVASAATKVACNTADDTIIPDYTVDANKQYYVIVKGDGAANAKGSYGLTVESIDGTATSMGCNAKAEAGDAFFKFNVNKQTDVTIDTVGSQFDTVLAIYPGNATVFGSNYAKDAFNQSISCDDNGAGGIASKISATLAPGNYYAVVKGKAATWGQAPQLFNLSVRDDGSTRAITCANAGGGAKITQTLPAGDYLTVLSDTDPVAIGSGGAYGITFKDLDASGQEAGSTQIGCALGTLDNGGGGFSVLGGQDYFVVVKGNTANDYGSYSLAVDDTISSQAQAGSTPIACAVTGKSIDAVYPPGDYYALVTGPMTSNGAYELQVRDADAFLDYNRIACDKDSGPNETSVIEADLKAGPHYVVVKGDGGSQTGTYQLNVRDMTAKPDNRIACADDSDSQRIEANVKANTDYTVLVKGDAKGEQGTYNISLYDELSLQGGGGQLLSCQTICPNIPPYNSCRPLGDSCSSNGQCCSGKCTSSKCSGTDPAGSQACRQSELTSSSFNTSLSADTYYMTVKGRKATEKGFYELQVGEVKATQTDYGYATNTKYVPPQWTEVKTAIETTGTKVLPVMSCASGGRCDGATDQAKEVARISGAKVKGTNQGLVRQINANGTGLGSGLAMAVRDLANYLAMDISLSVVDNPGFTINIQKCTNAASVDQAQCKHFSDCNDTSDVPRNTITGCSPGSTPKFFVQFTNPLDPNAVKKNPNDINGGYHFKLQIVGNKQYLLDEVPVYIIPTGNTITPPDPPGANTYMTSGTYEQQVFGAGCTYYKVEGEGPAKDSCSDKMDNNGDGKRDLGIDLNGDGDFIDANEFPPDPGCMAGSCADGMNNDGDMKSGMPLTDLMDPNCISNDVQDWTDLFFKADVPAGTSLVFDVCTGTTPAELTSCSYSRIATVTSDGTPCSLNPQCKNLMINGATRDGFCGKGGTCQFIDPPKLGNYCTGDAQCPNGDPGNGVTYYSFCKTSVNQCQYIAPPADVGSNLMKGANNKPYVKVKVTLNANSNKSKTPTLFDWYLTYNCRPQL